MPIISGNGIKRARIEDANESEEQPAPPTDDIAESLSDVDTKILEEAREFMPIFIIGVWEDEREEQRVSVAIHLPSGLLERPQNCEVRVSDNGLALQLTVMWPKCMTDMLYLHKNWLDEDRKAFINHPVFYHALWCLRNISAAGETLKTLGGVFSNSQVIHTLISCLVLG